MVFNKSNLVKKNNNSKPKTDLSQLFKLLYEKKGFFSLILVTLVIQLYITYYISENFDIEENKNKITNNHPPFSIDTNLIVAMLVLIFLTVILVSVPMPSWLKFIVFSLFSTVFGVILAYRKSRYDPNTIKTAFLGTISIFVSMFAFGVALIASNIQLSANFGLLLLYSLMLLIMISIAQFLTQSSLFYKFVVVCSLMLFSVYIVYDTNIILQRNYGGDFIQASLGYYIDIINIFTDLLSISEFDD